MVENTVPRLIAFYLPQFHPIPENDRWWGKGFTEWTNVARAKPLFPGHYQPQIPADLGFYDLRLAETREAQAELAEQHGISAFCYYHYWFRGKRLLERPFQEILESGKPDFPFCLCWANESWSRTWTENGQEILIRQEYSKQDDIDHIRYLATAFLDHRYIRYRNKPVFLVYRVSNIPDPLKTTNLWREEAIKLGVGELYLCRVESGPQEHTNPLAMGFDAAVEFQPDWRFLPRPRKNWIRKLGNRFEIFNNPLSNLKRFDYQYVVDKSNEKSGVDYKRFSCVTPRWDNTPRRSYNGFVLEGSSPDQYESWLREKIREAIKEGDKESLVFINAWNEWAEGNYLEPDLQYGWSYLEATRAALERNGEDRPSENGFSETGSI